MHELREWMDMQTLDMEGICAYTYPDQKISDTKKILEVDCAVLQSAYSAVVQNPTFIDFSCNNGVNVSRKITVNTDCIKLNPTSFVNKKLPNEYLISPKIATCAYPDRTDTVKNLFDALNKIVCEVVCLIAPIALSTSIVHFSTRFIKTYIVPNALELIKNFHAKGITVTNDDVKIWSINFKCPEFSCIKKFYELNIKIKIEMQEVEQKKNDIYAVVYWLCSRPWK
ncbi:hypothetical protein A3Q56_02119 [Intoshia linei]|uniref:Uncharacterized protein n=1 Tax=Intoshia linei TaxID=1819745 RepID=A0A177B8Z4_9BILA|nr:hypothetical protein A3Q56_02119 [Intoshia linei]